MVKMWFWCREDTYLRSSSWIRRDSDGKWQDQSSQRVENPYQDKESGKLLGVCKYLLAIHQELQPYSKISQWTQNKKWLEIRRRTSDSIWRATGQYHKLTSTYFSKER